MKAFALSVILAAAGGTCGLAATVSAAEDGRHLDRLLVRVDAAWRAMAKGRYSDVLALQADAGQMTRRERQKQVSFYKQASRSLKIISWSVRSLRMHGDVAEVTTVVQGLVREKDRWAEGVEEDIGYWVHKGSDWFLVWPKPDVFDDAAAVSIPLPVHQEGGSPPAAKIKIKE